MAKSKNERDWGKESIVMLFSNEYAKLIFLGFALAAPVAWYVMNLWLAEFANKINIGPAVSLTGIGLTLAISIFTIGHSKRWW